MKAIILAAGMGTRLDKYTKNLPKGMLNFAGKSLIQRQVETLRSCGITDISIITGYMPDKVNIKKVKYYNNPDFGNTNMVASLFCAEQELNDEVLVCYADILYEKRIIQQILDSDVDIGVTTDNSYWPYWQARLDNPEEDVESFIIQDDKVVELGTPDCKLEKARTRYVGLIKFSKKGVKALKKVYNENKEKFWDKDVPWLNSKSFKKAYMTDMIQSLINKNHEVNPIIISNGWMEFDTNEDYEKATKWLKENNLNRFYNPNA
ncbi:MAG: phosphocholine cytidylyltransferase family protein [Nanoarchaeota archaeon]